MKLYMKIGDNLIPLERAEMAREIGGAIVFIVLIAAVLIGLLLVTP